MAEQHLGIPQLLDVEDVCDISKPDERSVMTYVAEYFHAFSALDKVETAGRRVAKFAEVIASVWQMRNDYERRVLALMDAVLLAQREWQSTQLTDHYISTKQKGLEFNHYKNTQKREWVAEKREIDSLLGNIQTKLKTYNLKPYYPPEGLTLKVGREQPPGIECLINESGHLTFIIGFGQHLVRTITKRSILPPKHQQQD